MPSILFEQHLFKDQFKTSKFSDDKKPLSETCDVHQTIAILKSLAEAMSEEDPLSDTMERWGIANGFSPQDLAYVETVLCDSTERAFKIKEADESSARSFLAILGKKQSYKMKDVESHSHYSEGGTNRFLNTLKVQDWIDAFENRKAFSSSSYQQFPRKGKDYNYGHDYTDFNKQKPTNVALANPRLRVSTEEVFSAIDPSGMNHSTGWRCANLLTNELVSGYMSKEACHQMAAELNAELKQAILDEQEKNLGDNVEESVTRKHFREVANTVRAIEHPGVRQELADHHAEIFSTQNPRFDHFKFHAACGTKTKAERGIKEAKDVANIPIMENLLAPMSPVAQAALRHLESSHLKNGSASSFGDTNIGITAMQDFKAKENLLMEARKRENPLSSEEDAIRAQSVKNMHMRKRNG